MFRNKKATPKTQKGRRKLFPFLNEKGNIVVFYVMMMPVFMGAVALAVDFANVTAVRASLQVSADAATQGTVALSKNQAYGKPRFTSSADARAAAIKLYDANRSGMSQAGNIYKEGIPFLKCQTSKSGDGALVNPNSHCGFTLTEFKYSSNGGLGNGGYVTMTVQEKADTIFLNFLGFDDLTYTITSTARLTNTYN